MMNMRIVLGKCRGNDSDKLRNVDIPGANLAGRLSLGSRPKAEFGLCNDNAWVTEFLYSDAARELK